MEKIVQSIESTLSNVDLLEISIISDNIDNSEIISTKLNNYIASLEILRQASKAMDSATLFPIPMELLNNFDENEINPDEYQKNLLSNYENKANDLANRIFYLKSLKENVLQNIESNNIEKDSSS